MNHEQIAKKVRESIKDKRVKVINTHNITSVFPELELKPFSDDDMLIKIYFSKLSGRELVDYLPINEKYFKKEWLKEVYGVGEIVIKL